MRVATFASLASFVGIACASAVAAASVSLPVTWEALVHGSTAAAVVSPREAHAVWEDGHICTYTRVHVEQAVAGDLATGDEPWVRTLGGVVGKVGQIVDGEAVFSPGRSSLLFMRRDATGTLDVTARGQGQFPVVAGADTAHSPTVVESHAVGMIVPRPAAAGGTPVVVLASEQLHGRVVDDAVHQVVAVWASLHAR